MASSNTKVRGRRQQELVREVNERIREVSGTFDGPVEFLCECAAGDCAATLELTLAQYDGLVAEPGRVLLALPHSGAPDGRRVLAEYERFVVVQADY